MLNMTNTQHTSFEVSNIQTRPSLLRRIWQYQPSTRLVKLVFVWWLLLVVTTAFELTDGFGYDILDQLTPLLFNLCLGFIVILALLAFIDWLWLLAISQTSYFKLSREHPTNVPIYHEQNIQAYLSFDASFSANSNSNHPLNGNNDEPNNENHHLIDDNFNNNSLLLSKAFGNFFKSIRLLKSIRFEFSDGYPDELTLTDTSNTITSVTSENAIRNAVMSIPVVLSIKNNFDSASSESATQNEAQSSTLPSMVKITYPVLPIQRGTGYFSAAHLRIWSPFRLLHRQIKLSDSRQNQTYIRVLADFSGLLNNHLAAIFERSPNSGLQTLMQQGHGSDFLNLREYAPGDAIRQIDWKASSRQRRLMSKSYEDDNDQQIVFLLDCGEQMRHKDDSYDSDHIIQGQNDVLQTTSDGVIEVSYFDKVLNAVLLLSYIANKQSDSVGLMTFGGIDKYIPPKKGGTLIRNLLNDTADIKPTMQTSDYLSAAQSLRKQLKKRSLIILITNTRVEASNELIQAVRLLASHHQIVFANLSEQIVHDKLHGEMLPSDLDDALLFHSLNSYEKERLQLHSQLTQESGALCFHTTANKLPPTLIQAYLSLRR